MQQLSWFDAVSELVDRALPVRSTRARRTDPQTSHLAAKRIERVIRPQQQTVLDALKRFPGSTAVELAKAAELDRYMVSRRLPELARDGWARRHLPRVCRENGSPQTTWYPVQR